MPIFKSNEFKKTILSTTGLLIILPLVILVNVVFSFFNLRLDATQDKVFSLSEGSKHALSQLQEKVTIKYYWSRSDVDFPREIKIYAGQVSDFLSELQHVANGKIVVEQYDPKPDSEEEEFGAKVRHHCDAVSARLCILLRTGLPGRQPRGANRHPRPRTPGTARI